MIGGVVVGLTSVGSGSLMIIMLLFLYPMLGANQLVGTDLDAGRSADARRGARRAHLRARRIRGHDLADPRQRAGRADRLAVLLERARPLRPARDHVRDHRLGAEVRRARHRRHSAGSSCAILVAFAVWLALENAVADRLPSKRPPSPPTASRPERAPRRSTRRRPPTAASRRAARPDVTPRPRPRTDGVRRGPMVRSYADGCR